MPTETPAEGTAAPAPAPAPDDNTAYMAGLNARLRGEVTDETEPPKDNDEKPAAKPGDDEDGAAADDEDKPDKAAADEDEDDDQAEDEKVDKDALRKLSKERRTFNTFKTEVLALERSVKERAQALEAREQQVIDFASTVQVNPVGTFLSKGLLGQVEIDHWAKQFYLYSTDGQKDPRAKGEAERLQREHARDIENRRALERVDKLERERAQEKAQAENDKQLNSYVARIESSIAPLKAKTPLLAKAMETDPAVTKRELYAVAYELASANNGQYADPTKVVLTWEKQQRARLVRLGLSPPAAAPATSTSTNKAKSPTAAKNQGQGPTKKDGAAEPEKDPDIAASDEEFRAELARRLKRG